jgi:hypothetical protein
MANNTSLYGSNGNVLPAGDNVIITGTLTVNGCAILTDCSTFNLLPFNATTVNVGGSATTLALGATTGVTTIRNQLATANYDFPLADGLAGQVLVTDGAGVLSFAAASSVGKTYDIDATTTTGGANLNLNSNLPTIDSVKFASGGGTVVTRTDANTITITSPGTGGAMSLNDLSDVVITSETQGDFLFYNGTDWVNDNQVSTTIANNRPNFQYIASNPGSNSSIILSKNYGATPFAAGDGSGIRFELNSNTQPATEFAILHVKYSATTPDFVLATSIDDGASYQDAMQVSTSRVNINGDLEIDGDTIFNSFGEKWIEYTQAASIYGTSRLANFQATNNIGVRASYMFIDGNVEYNTNNLTTSATTPDQVLSFWDQTTIEAVKSTIKVVSGGAVQCIEVLMVQDGTTISLNTYGDVRTAGNLTTVSSGYNAITGYWELRVTPVNAVTSYAVTNQIMY